MNFSEDKSTEFYRGIRSNSLWVMPFSLIISVVLLGLIELAFMSGLIWRLPVALLLPDIRNDWIFQAHRLNNLKNHGGEGHKLYILGGSSCREAFISEMSIQEALSRAGNPGHRVLNMCTSSQTMADTFLIIESLGQGPGNILIGLNPLKFSYGRDVLQETIQGHRFIMKSENLKRYLGSLGIKSKSLNDFYFWRAGPYLGELLLKPVRILGDMINRGQFTLGHQFLHHAHRTPPTPADIEENKKELRSKHFKNFMANKDLNLKIFSLVIEKAMASGFKVILFELPMNPIVRDHYLDVLNIYQPMIRRFASKYQLPYLEYMWGLPLDRSDFFDFSHLLDRGRSIYQDAFVSYLNDLL